MRTNNLVFRDLSLEDSTMVYEYATDPYTLRFLNWMLKDMSETRKYLERLTEAQEAHPRYLYKFGIVEQSTDLLIGEVELVKLYSEPAGRFRLILNKKYWKKGYGYECGLAMLTLAFKLLRLDRVYASCHKDNEGGLRMLQKLGAVAHDPIEPGIQIGRFAEDLRFFQMTSHEFFSPQKIDMEDNFIAAIVDK